MHIRLRTLPIYITTAITLAAWAATSGCSEEERQYVANLSEPETMPTMLTEDVLTLVSDSGYTRYRMTAPLWLMFDEAADPHWTFPQYMIDIDAAKAKQAGISPKDILSTLQGYYGGMYVSNFNRFGKIYRVMMQAAPESRVSPETLSAIKIRNGNEMASLANYVTLTKVYGPDLLNRFNMFQSISVTGQPAPGYTSGDCLAAIERVAAETLPAGFGYEYSGMTREEASSGAGSTTAIIFGLCLLF